MSPGVVPDVYKRQLDTPGHQDFAEDTYRTLTAVDSVIIVVDGAKGVETQTRKMCIRDSGNILHIEACQIE